MNLREFSHANNPIFCCAESVLLLPFGRRSFLPAIVEGWGGEAEPLDETTDREVFRLTAAPSEIYEHCAGLVIAVESECAAVAVVGARLGLDASALLFCTDNVNQPREEDRGYRGLTDPRVRRGFEAGLGAAIEVLSKSIE